MSNPVKLRCLDENGGNMLVVSTSTKGSTGASTGALVLNNAGLSINSTENSVSASAGGALTVAGGAAFGSDLRVAKDIYFYGDLYQNNSLFQSGSGTGGSSQWTSGTDGSVSYTSGNVNITDLVSTNFSAGNLVASALNLGMSSMFSGSFSASNNISAATNVSGLAFGEDKSSFSGSIMVYIDATTDLYEHFMVSGNRKISGWELYVSSQGDESGIDFTITSGGQIQYTSSNVSGFVSSTFRYSFTQINNSGTYSPVAPSTSGTFIYDTIQISGTQPAQPGTNNGSLYVLGGATVEKNLLVNGGMTVGNLNLTGTLSQNGSPYASSQWTSTAGNVSYTSGSVIVKELSTMAISTTSTNYNLGSYDFFYGFSNEIIDNNFEIVGTTVVYKGTVTKTFNFRFTFSTIVGSGYESLYIETYIVDSNYNPISPSYTSSIPSSVSFDTGFFSVTFQPEQRMTVTIGDGPSPANAQASTFQYATTNTPTTLSSNGNLTVSGNLNLSGTLSAIGSSNTLGSLITTGGNIGIGTSSPNAKLHVNGNIITNDITMGALTLSGSIRMDNQQILYAKNASGNYEEMFWPRWNDNATYLNYGAGGFVIRNHLSNLAMNMATNGNIGIGTFSPAAKLDVSGDIRVTSGSLLATGNSNTLGALITTGGNVGIGTTSPNTRLHIHSSSETTLRVSSPGYTGFDIISGETGHAGLYNRNNNYMHFGTNNTERMRITASGNVGIGTSSPTHKLHISNGGILSYGSDSYQHIGYTIQTPNYVYQLGISGSTGWATVGTFGIYNSNAGSHSLVIQPNGNIGIGTNSPNSRLHVTGGGNGGQNTPLALVNSSATTYRWDIGPNAVGDYVVSYNNTGMYLNKGNPGSGWISFSDARLKENVESITSGLQTIKSLNPVKFNWKSSPDRQYKSLGLIAQEVQEVIPEIVHILAEPVHGEVYGVQYTSLIPYLIAALQEVESELQETKQELQTLKSFLQSKFPGEF